MKRLIIGLIALAIGGVAAPAAEAAFIVTMTQVGSDVVAVGTGTLNTSDLTQDVFTEGLAALYPSGEFFIFGGIGSLQLLSYRIPAGPSVPGSPILTVPSAGSGGLVGVTFYQASDLVVPAGYVSGSALSITDTFDGATFATLGITPGTYVWNFGRGTDADSFTLRVTPAAVAGAPEPESIALLGIGIAALGVVRRRRAG